jgi:hypothetical protein
VGLGDHNQHASTETDVSSRRPASAWIVVTLTLKASKGRCERAPVCTTLVLEDSIETCANGVYGSIYLVLLLCFSAARLLQTDSVNRINTPK